MYFIISKQMVIILHIEVIQSVLMCYCKKKMVSAANLYSEDVIVDIITIRENSKFSLTPFCKSAGCYIHRLNSQEFQTVNSPKKRGKFSKQNMRARKLLNLPSCKC